MQRGRKPKPTAVHKLNGNPSKINLKKREETEPQVQGTAPTCPSWLDGVAKKEWHRVSRELSKLKLLTSLDRTALAGYCQSFSTLRTAQQELRKGLTFPSAVGPKPKPEVKIAHDALTQIRAFCVEFGLTPSSRSRMTLPAEPQEEDPVEVLMRQAEAVAKKTGF